MEAAHTSTDLLGCLPLFPALPGGELRQALPLHDFTRKRLVFNSFSQPGQIHVYRADCRAGERLRVQTLAPVLPNGGSVLASSAVVAQSLPYSADVEKLPVALPAGYSAVVAPSPSHLESPIKDALTGVTYYPGPVIDVRTLVGGRCYIVVWNPQNRMGKYVLNIGHRWPLRWTYWVQVPRFWLQIRHWFGLDQTAAYALGTLLLGGALGAAVTAMLIRRQTS